MPAAKSRIAVFPCGVLCTFWPQKVPKTPRRMPSPTSSRLTFETGARLKGGFKGRWAAERVISDTTLSLLKPASYAGARAFSRAFVSRLRHRAGVVRRETRREGCVRDKQKAQKPTFVPKEGGGWGERNGSKRPAGCRAANNPRRSNPAAQADAPKGWGERNGSKKPAGRRTAKIFATKRQRYPTGEDRGMFHVLSVTKAQTKRPAKRRPFFRRMPDKSL